MRLRPVLRGEPVTLAVTDGIGFYRAPAPDDGVAWDDEGGDRCGFLALSALVEALSDLDEKIRTTPRVRGGAPGGPVARGGGKSRGIAGVKKPKARRGQMAGKGNGP